MRSRVFILFFLCTAFRINAQVIFKTVVPRRAITKGESFQVQYVFEGNEKITNFKAPLFSNFRLVTGPDSYNGTDLAVKDSKIYRNTVFTLEALEPGKFIIPGAGIVVNGKFIQSADAFIEVVSPEEAIKRAKKNTDNSAYFLKPGEDPYEKIRQNLFLKLTVDKKSCYVGEPVLATFKLYSRLESKSDVVKNPGFYGFTVFDMINLADNVVTLEKFNNKAFDVHTIRKVQLFPLQTGLFSIDPMELTNKIEFTQSAIYKKTEQEITEGVLGADHDFSDRENSVVFEKSLQTDPVQIDVKPFPANKPASFSGAVGNFKIDIVLSGNKVQKNDQGFLNITIEGKGNFIQLTPPSIQWPKGIEGFDPLISDSFSRSASPIVGKRTFRYPFIASEPGEYSIPSISFSFFNPDSGKYKNIETPLQQITILNSSVPPFIQSVSKKVKSIKTSYNRMSYLILAVLIISGFSGFFLWNYRKQKKISSFIPTEKYRPAIVSIDELLLPAMLYLPIDDENFYAELYQGVWAFFSSRFKLSGSEISKENLLSILREKNLQEDSIAGVQDILLECEQGRFARARLSGDKNTLLATTKNLLNEIDKSLL